MTCTLALCLSAAQMHWAIFSYNIGSEYGLGKYTTAIILTESSACQQNIGDDGESWGCGQLQVATAQRTCKCSISSATLLQDPRRNIEITAAFLSECFQNFWPDKDRSIYCFNRGIPQASKASANQIAGSSYVKRVKYWLSEIRKIPISHD